ncbi:hypothetical protein SLS61_007780 [Didymella pomorum]
MSQSTPPARGIPVFYRLFFTWLDPIICLWGAYLDFFAPRTVLSSHILNDTPDIGHIMILKQRGGNMLNFGFISAFLLRYTSDLKIWHIIEIGLLITDFAYFPAVFGAMNAQHRVLPETWRAEDWGSLVVTGFATLVRLAFCARVGFSGEEDRMSKHYKGYNLTNLEVQQNYDVGQDYRNIYLTSSSPKRILDISEDQIVNSQIYASAPDQAVLLNTATAFLQGLYPPLENIDQALAAQTLNSNERVIRRLGDYQYLIIQGENDNSPDIIWLKGDEQCPSVTISTIQNKESTDFKQRVEETRAFYESFWDQLSSRFAGGILEQLEQIVTTKGKLKFTLLAGSYDTFLEFFGLNNLSAVSGDFRGLPHYASTMAFEVFTRGDVTAFPNVDDLRVRLMFRNGSTKGEASRAYPLFGGQEQSLPYNDFVSKMKEFAINSTEQWCSTCRSDALFCQAYSARDNASKFGRTHSAMLNAIAGVIGALSTLGIIGLGGLLFVLIRRRRSAINAGSAESNVKGSIISQGSSM